MLYQPTDLSNFVKLKGSVVILETATKASEVISHSCSNPRYHVTLQFLSLIQIEQRFRHSYMEVTVEDEELVINY